MRPATEMDRGEKPFIKEWGEQSAPKWSPDGRKIAFVSTRTDHSFIVVYDVATRTVNYMSPSVDFDTSPMWTWTAAASSSCAGPGCRSVSRRSRAAAASVLRTVRRFSRAPGGRAAAAAAGAALSGARRGAQSAARGDGAPRAGRPEPGVDSVPGLMRAAFKGGYTLSVWKADVATGEAQEVWHNEPNDRVFTTLTNRAARRRLRRVPAHRRRGRPWRPRCAAAARGRPPRPERPGRRVGPLLLAEPRDADRDARCC